MLSLPFCCHPKAMDELWMSFPFTKLLYLFVEGIPLELYSGEFQKCQKMPVLQNKCAENRWSLQAIVASAVPTSSPCHSGCLAYQKLESETESEPGQSVNFRLPYQMSYPLLRVFNSCGELAFSSTKTIQYGVYSCTIFMSQTPLIIDREAREIMHLVASVCPFVCLFACTLLFEPFDLWPWFLVPPKGQLVWWAAPSGGFVKFWDALG